MGFLEEARKKRSRKPQRWDINEYCVLVGKINNKKKPPVVEDNKKINMLVLGNSPFDDEDDKIKNYNVYRLYDMYYNGRGKGRDVKKSVDELRDLISKSSLKIISSSLIKKIGETNERIEP